MGEREDVGHDRNGGQPPPAKRTEGRTPDAHKEHQVIQWLLQSSECKVRRVMTTGRRGWLGCRRLWWDADAFRRSSQHLGA